MNPDATAAATLERTRSAVLNVLVLIGLGIAVSGWALRRQDAGATRWPLTDAQPWAYAALLALVVISHLARRILGARGRLRDPSRRDARFYWAHVAGATVGALEVPLGFAYAWAVRPRLDAVLPFWVAALALGVLALPRPYELEGLDPTTDGTGAANDPGEEARP